VAGPVWRWRWGAVGKFETALLQVILAEPDWAGRMTGADRRALTPLFWTHVNLYGRFDLDMDTRLNLDQALAVLRGVPGQRRPESADASMTLRTSNTSWQRSSVVLVAYGARRGQRPEDRPRAGPAVAPAASAALVRPAPYLGLPVVSNMKTTISHCQLPGTGVEEPGVAARNAAGSRSDRGSALLLGGRLHPVQAPASSTARSRTA
jgi:hypothetical protein